PAASVPVCADRLPCVPEDSPQRHKGHTKETERESPEFGGRNPDFPGVGLLLPLVFLCGPLCDLCAFVVHSVVFTTASPSAPRRSRRPVAPRARSRRDCRSSRGPHPLSSARSAAPR